MKTNLHSMFKTDKDLENNGIWIEISDDVRFLVRRFGGNNTHTKAAFAKYYKPKARLISAGQLPDEELTQVMVKVFVASCLVTWEGVTDADGNELPFNEENAVQLFLDLPELFETISEEAKSLANYKEDLGKS